ncbi:hypothetical protein JOB18_023488 [Solea senegalensis]|uniref:Uncharacterized protein n=1 Tax=Solea senegalensis TaxID=28829 RepID=A0AAV6SUI7_SOLSE|nr:hypothetical protein JOB18_023488 [Solea senegalensis]
MNARNQVPHARDTTAQDVYVNDEIVQRVSACVVLGQRGINVLTCGQVTVCNDTTEHKVAF